MLIHYLFRLIWDPESGRLGRIRGVSVWCVWKMKQSDSEVLDVFRFLILCQPCACCGAPLRTRTANLSANRLWLRGITAHSFGCANYSDDFKRITLFLFYQGKQNKHGVNSRTFWDGLWLKMSNTKASSLNSAFVLQPYAIPAWRLPYRRNRDWFPIWD